MNREIYMEVIQGRLPGGSDPPAQCHWVCKSWKGGEAHFMQVEYHQHSMLKAVGRQ